MFDYAAMVTGASEGLGKSFAIELASRGANLVLVALPATGLPQLASFLEMNFGIRVIYFEKDLTTPDACHQLFYALSARQITISILINNAGLGNLSLFEEKTAVFYKMQIELNSIIPVMMTRHFLGQIDRNVQNHVLNVGSLGGRFMVPRKQVYGATKSFIRYFTKALRSEMAGSSVSISLLSPGGIDTKPELLVMNAKLNALARASILEPEMVARIAIDGMLRGKTEIIPGRLNRFFVLINNIIPDNLQSWVISRQLKTGASMFS